MGWVGTFWYLDARQLRLSSEFGNEVLELDVGQGLSLEPRSSVQLPMLVGCICAFALRKRARKRAHRGRQGAGGRRHGR